MAADVLCGIRPGHYSQKMTTENTILHVPARDVPTPKFLSPLAQAVLNAGGSAPLPFPAIDDKEGWRALVKAMDQALLPMIQSMSPDGGAQVADRTIGAVRVFDITPALMEADDRTIVLDLHGGGLIYCGGTLCRIMGIGIANRLRRRVWSVDYRMPPDHPYPAALDDGLAVYRALLTERSPREILINGASAGGNLAAALTLRIRDSGLPMPAGVYLDTPEIDLTESGDSFHTNLGVDAVLRSLMPVNLLYANGHDLAHPYLSPLFADFTQGFPPTILTTGTRDLYLSNTVRMHRALRAADIAAELHVVEAGGHGGFPSGSPEGDQIDKEVRRFIATALSASVARTRLPGFRIPPAST